MSSSLEAKLRRIASSHGLPRELAAEMIEALHEDRPQEDRPQEDRPQADRPQEDLGSITHATFAYPSSFTPPDFATSFSLTQSLPGSPPLSDPPSRLLGRYEVLGRIGLGGMGEVLRVRDATLNREMALKVIHGHIAVEQLDLRRFVDEAQITAQLRHPSVVPVHELGELEDGRLYFTMEEIRGRTLSVVIREVHEASEGGPWRPTEEGWSLRRLVEALRRVGEGVAYAHSRGVLHRDLKPSNVLLGEFGEVSVLDWGLALLFEGARGAAQSKETRIHTASLPTVGASLAATDSRVAGTPSYMSPEQARGDRAAMGPASDIFSLGAILFKILTGRAPFRGGDANTIVRRVMGNEREPMTRLLGQRGPGDDPYLPEELIRICDRAMHPEPSERYLDARRMVEDLAAWLEGLKRKDQALDLVASADALHPEVKRLRAQAAQLRAEAAALLDGHSLHDPVALKRPAWDKQDEADGLEVEARVRLVRVIRILQAALSHDPDLIEAHDRLAALYQDRHASAERAHNAIGAAQWEELLRSHDRGRHRAYLRGFGKLTLRSDPSGAQVQGFRYALEGRRLIAQPIGALGVTPLESLELPIGSYLLTIEAEGHEPVRYPVKIEREGHWTNTPPDGTEPWPVHLPPQGALGPDDVFIPAGWFTCGGDIGAAGSLPRQEVWLDDFVMRRHPVTHAEYLRFLNALVDGGRGQEAEACVPRFEAFPLYSRDDDGRFVMRDDFLFLKLAPDMPVLMTSYFAAAAMAAWEAQTSGLPWSLPSDLEWEKAARGVDARRLPWGDFMDPTWCNMRDSSSVRPMPARVGEFPVDESPYGVRGLAGNIMDWCRDSYRVSGPPILNGRVSPGDTWVPADAHRVVRGGHWYGVGQIAYAAHRLRLDPEFMGYLVGFRLARAYGKTSECSVMGQRGAQE